MADITVAGATFFDRCSKRRFESGRRFAANVHAVAKTCDRRNAAFSGLSRVLRSENKVGMKCFFDLHWEHSVRNGESKHNRIGEVQTMAMKKAAAKKAVVKKAAAPAKKAAAPKPAAKKAAAPKPAAKKAAAKKK